MLSIACQQGWIILYSFYRVTPTINGKNTHQDTTWLSGIPSQGHHSFHGNTAAVRGLLAMEGHGSFPYRGISHHQQCCESCASTMGQKVFSMALTERDKKLQLSPATTPTRERRTPRASSCLTIRDCIFVLSS